MQVLWLDVDFRNNGMKRCMHVRMVLAPYPDPARAKQQCRPAFLILCLNDDLVVAVFGCGRMCLRGSNVTVTHALNYEVLQRKFMNHQMK